MTTTESAGAPAAPHRRLRLALIAVGAISLLEGLSGLPAIFVDYGHDTALLAFVQGMTSVQLALSPLVAGAALYFAVRGRLRHAILALAALALMVWLFDLPSILIHGFEFSADYGGMQVFIHRILFPATAIAGAWLAWHDRRLALAGLLVSVPVIVNGLGVLAFGIGVLIYGF